MPVTVQVASTEAGLIARITRIVPEIVEVAEIVPEILCVTITRPLTVEVAKIVAGMIGSVPNRVTIPETTEIAEILPGRIALVTLREPATVEVAATEPAIL